MIYSVLTAFTVSRMPKQIVRERLCRFHLRESFWFVFLKPVWNSCRPTAFVGSFWDLDFGFQTFGPGSREAISRIFRIRNTKLLNSFNQKGKLRKHEKLLNINKSLSYPLIYPLKGLYNPFTGTEFKGPQRALKNTKQAVDRNKLWTDRRTDGQRQRDRETDRQIDTLRC